MVCGIGRGIAAVDTNDDVTVYFEDRNPNEAPDWLGCQALSVDEDWGDISTGGMKYACSTGGGCSAAPAGYTGETYLTLTDVRHGGVCALEVLYNATKA